MIKRTIKITKAVISKTILAIVIFILLLGLFSADWFLETFGEMDFSVVVYQLFSPMEGTSAEILEKYYNNCFRPALGIAWFFIVVYILYDAIFRKCYLSVTITFLSKNIQLLLNNKFRFISKLVILVLGISYLLVSCINRAQVLGIPEYIKEITDSSTIFEEEYVNPNEIVISFPEKKRNLLLIYLESMEATYASVEEGGAYQKNYIPELTELAVNNLSFSDSDKLGGAHVYANGWTMGALLSCSTGVPYKLPIGGNDAGEYEKFLPGITGLGDILLQEGYNNYFMCGSDAYFGGRKAFYQQHGNYQIFDYWSAQKDGIIPEGYEVFWGMEDKKCLIMQKRN